MDGLGVGIYACSFFVRNSFRAHQLSNPYSLLSVFKASEWGMFSVFLSFLALCLSLEIVGRALASFDMIYCLLALRSIEVTGSALALFSKASLNLNCQKKK